MNDGLRSPIKWLGGKGHLIAKLFPLIPPHNIYVEVFGGGASLLFAKTPSPIEVYNDLDSGLVNFFRVLRDPEKFARFYHLAVLTPYAREEHDFARRTWESCEDEVEKAYRWFIVARMSFGGRFGASWGSDINKTSGGCVETTAGWLSVLRLLPDIHKRVATVQVEHADFRNILERYDTEDTFFYLDPPYVPDTRKSGSYECELTLDDHAEIVDRLLHIKGKALLSGYAHSVHNPLEKWNRLDFQAVCHSAGKTRHTGILGEGAATEMQPRIETVWFNYTPGQANSLF